MIVVSVAAADVAVIVAEPLLIEVTNPSAEIVAIRVSDVAQLTVGLTIVLSFASLPLAVSRVVSPSAVNESAGSDSVMLTAT
jgi:hypothetical protein